MPQKLTALVKGAWKWHSEQIGTDPTPNRITSLPFLPCPAPPCPAPPCHALMRQCAIVLLRDCANAIRCVIYGREALGSLWAYVGMTWLFISAYKSNLKAISIGWACGLDLFGNCGQKKSPATVTRLGLWACGLGRLFGIDESYHVGAD